MLAAAIEKRSQFIDKQKSNGQKGGRPKTQIKPKQNPDHNPNKTQSITQTITQTKPYIENENENINGIKDGIKKIDLGGYINTVHQIVKSKKLQERIRREYLEEKLYEKFLIEREGYKNE